MKKQKSFYISLVILLAASSACSVAGTVPAAQEPTTVIEPTISAATAIPAPSQEAVGIDGPPGPETIDLGNPALYTAPGATAFTQDYTVKFTGVDTTGAAKEFLLMRQSSEIQTQPQIAQHFFVSFDEEGGSTGTADTVVLGDQLYTVQVFSGGPTGCKILPTSSVKGSMLDSMFKPQGMITGQAQRVESGIAVNGFVTDKYELSKENLLVDKNLTSELISAFVYVARSTGSITFFERQSRTKTDTYGFDPNQFTDISFAYNYIPVEDGSLEIAIPAACNK